VNNTVDGRYAEIMEPLRRFSSKRIVTGLVIPMRRKGNAVATFLEQMSGV
jgi:hypothetical protein